MNVCVHVSESRCKVLCGGVACASLKFNLCRKRESGRGALAWYDFRVFVSLYRAITRAAPNTKRARARLLLLNAKNNYYKHVYIHTKYTRKRNRNNNNAPTTISHHDTHAIN